MILQFNTKMTQIANIALFLTSSSLFRFKPSSSSLSFSFLSKPKTPRKPLSVFSYSSSSKREEERRFQPPPLSRGKSSSSSTTSSSREDKMSKEKEKKKLDSSMEEIPGFNKRRAEGRDKNDKPKNLQLKVRKLNPVNTISYVQILGTGLDTQDTSPSVLLFFDKQRFIFNAGEGLQRFCTEHKIKLSKIDHIFLTRVCSETAGGLPGLLLTLAGLGDEGMSVNMSGPSDLNYLVDAMRSFIPNAAMVHTNSFKHAPNVDRAEPIVLIDDEVVKISAFLLQPNSFKGSQIIKGDTSPSSQGKRNLQSEDPNGKDERMLKPGDISVIYVCELPEIKGKFDLAKAVALGLKPGPKYRQLQLGQSVQSDSQNVEIRPSDVLGPSIPGPIVLLVDCPTMSHLQELPLKSLSIYYEATKDDPPDVVKKSVSCIIHLSPSSVAMTDGYQSWMKRFGEAQHIMAGHEIKNIEVPILKASARVAARLNYLCPQFFPAPGFWALQHLSNIGPESTTSSEVSAPKLSGSIAAENLLKFHLRPYSQLGLDRSVIPSLSSPTEVVNELLTEIPEIIDAAEQLSHLWNRSRDTKKIIVPLQEDNIMTEEPWTNGSGPIPDMHLNKEGLHASREEILSVDTVNVDQVNHESAHPSCLENITREDMEIVLLGTGSSQPSKYRNVSSIYVNLFSKGSLLLDCGEGTLGQLKRRFGVMGADDAVRGLRCIWISHIHADHHTGLARILALRSKLLRGVPHDPLLVVGPRQLKRFLDAYQRLEDLDMQFLDCRHTTMDALKSNEKSSSVSPVNGSLFIKDTPMQSILKRPGSPVDTSAVSHILKNLKRVLGEAGLKALISVPVVHCPQAFGLILEAAERINSVGKTIPGWKLAYSGDTRPCPELIDAACGATVLIHEATFEDSMVDEAIARNHSTTKEAIEVGESAGAYRTILTHFSQRYPKIPVFDETYMHSTCIGFDMMSINIADLPVLPKVLPYLKLLFKNEMIVDESDNVEESDDVEDSSILQPEI